ncbi:MAG: hypothetical protein ACUVWX_10270 [Kiritimatiellia bacterium]
MNNERVGTWKGSEKVRSLVALTILNALGAALGAEKLLPNQWVKVDEGKTGQRNGSMLVYVPELRQMLLVGSAKGAHFVQALDLGKRIWTEYDSAVPAKGGLHNYYQTTYDPGSKSLYCLSGGTVLYVLNVVEKTWSQLPPAP